MSVHDPSLPHRDALRQSSRQAPSPPDPPGPPDPRDTHGGRVLAVARRLGVPPDSILDFSNNANSLVADLTAECLAGLRPEHRFYPDAACRQLVEALSRHEALPPDHLLAANGSAEAILLTLLAIRDENRGPVLVVAPIFSEYVRCCEALGLEHALRVLAPENGFALAEADLDAMAASPARTIILCTPNNPTGQIVPDLPGLLRRLSGKTLVLDLAYKEFLWERPHGGPAWEAHRPAALLAGDADVISLCSLTKFFFCPGLRLGFVAARPDRLRAIRDLQPPWSVSQLAQDAGVRLLDRTDAFRARQDQWRQAKTSLLEGLRRLPGLERLVPGQGNFVLLRLTTGRGLPLAPALAAALEDQGVLVRHCATIPGLSPDWIRLQVRTPAENARLLAALANLLA